MAFALTRRARFVSLFNYSSCFNSNKRLVWEKLITFKGKWSNGEWSLGWNFNVIKNVNKIRGRSNQVRLSEIQEFNDFIDLVELMDVPTIDRRFTWTNGMEVICQGFIYFC